jgi:uncharacterized protein (TIGR01777 family)
MKIIIAGGSGHIGKSLTRELISAGHEITILSRNTQGTSKIPVRVKVIEWDGQTTKGWWEHVNGSDAIVNLAGENLAGNGFFPKRWTAERKQLIRQSRLRAGKAIVAAIEVADKKPQVVIQSSAIGYYGPLTNQTVDESAKVGNDFLSQLCQEWEESTQAIKVLGVRQVVVRTGVVLMKDGGALARLLLPFRLFLGGPFGNGRQVMSWIHIADVVAAIRFLIESPQSTGVYNLVAPNPVTNAELGKILGKLMQRPSWIPVPGFAMRMLFGEVASVVLDGQRVSPQRLLESGYSFKYPTIEESLINILEI